MMNNDEINNNLLIDIYLFFLDLFVYSWMNRADWHEAEARLLNSTFLVNVRDACVCENVVAIRESLKWALETQKSSNFVKRDMESGMRTYEFQND